MLPSHLELWDVLANGCWIWLRRCLWWDVGRGGQDRALLTPAILLQESIPFAVIGSNTVVEAKGRRVRGRLYPWGIVEGNTGPCPRRPTGLLGTGTLRATSPCCSALGGLGECGGLAMAP